MREFTRVVLNALLALLAITILLPMAKAQFTQQGNKLVGTGAVAGAFGGAEQGYSVAVSADGNTAIVGAPFDNDGAGAAWVYTRSGSTWSQQGSKLVGTGGVGADQLAVAISADGNTALVGGAHDNSNAGAAWVFTRSGGVWTQQGAKLVGTGAFGNAFQGAGVALSADGNTAIVGGPTDNFSNGAVWVYTRSGGAWTQQGGKLVGTGAVGNSFFGNPSQGGSVALSADGNTLIEGAGNDNGGVGATWIFTRSGGVWTQQGSKLIATDAAGNSEQGGAVAISADGNTAIVGGPYDANLSGAAWVYTRSGGVWSQQGGKLVGTGAVGAAAQGSVALSGDGNTALVGGPYDNGKVGATWVYTRSGGVWTQQGSKLVGTGGATSMQGAAVALSADGNTAIVGGPYDNSFAGAIWVFVNPPLPVVTGVVNGASFVPGMVPNSWVTIQGTNLSAIADVWDKSIVNGNLPTSLDGVKVNIGGKLAYIYYVSPGQLNAVAPDVGAGTFSVTVTNANGTSAPVNVTSQTAGPGLFLWPGKFAVATRQDYSWAVKNGTFPSVTTTPAKPGDVIILWGTGFGPTNPLAPVGVQVPSDKTYVTSSQVSVTVGGTPAQVYGAALAPGFAGLYQVAIQIPPSAPDGDLTVVASLGAPSPSTALITVQH